MSMIEVDPKLFITCRLCLVEMGQYQIVPQVQIQIKYCFDIEVQPFDGLPQLICKKCESILSQYAEIKKKFQEKQSGLRKNIKENNKPMVPSTNQQQDTVSSTQQVDSECNTQISKTIQKDNKIFVSTCRNSSLDREPAKDNRKLLGVNKNVAKRSNSVWKNDYEKNFVCRFCAKSLKNKKSIVHHLKQCHLLRNYSNVIRRCVITMNKIDSIPNLTFSNENVVHGTDKIINSQLKNYYILYTKKINVVKSISSDSSDEDFSIPRKKRKRLRLFSRSSNETLVIENNNTSPSFVKSDRKDEKQKDTNSNEKELTDVSDIELINIDDSDSASTASRTTLNKAEPIQDETPQESTIENDKVIQNIVNMCYNKYLKRLNTSGKNSKDTENDESFLQRKLLSMGRKVIHKKGLISTGLIRYMEHKDLNVDWIPKCTANVTIKTTLKDNSNNESNELNWKCIKDVDNTYTDKDFVDIFETMDKVRNVEQSSQIKDVREIENNVTLDLKDGVHLSKQSNYDDSAKVTNSSLALVVPYDKNIYERKVENSVLFIRTTPETEKQTILKKLLNENPVANPKKLPKKATPVELFTLLTNSSSTSKTDTSSNSEISNNMSGGHMPIITSTMSLATLNEDEKNKESVNKPESETNKSYLALPRIKVKSVADLMPENTVPKSFIGPSNSWTSCLYNDDQNGRVQNKNTRMAYNVTNNEASYMNINSQCPNTNSYSQYDLNKSTDKGTLVPNSNESPGNKEQYVIMHTVELPHTKTKSPFRYLQQLLQIHNIVLLSNADIVSSNMSCLIKFKLVFHQESSVAVTLCLSFYCKQNTFCIRVMDINSKLIDIVKLSAYWQWEILKEFKGNVVPRLYENASKISQDILQQTYHFVRFLNSIEFSK
ncbi:uncharacterized protein LOC126776275 isoform X2 [Nymphalis io]|uniref:uncharacterized protein LOC126776275 isoform X2 n=1 Tax=Inachis io TaxID=171585 RepID=UPI002168B545|nr:uncharacterized protein LOC126776275 isoform X2 [Nymphalis io]